ncbi:MAG TPA: ribonuclease P protein component [Flavobacteriales bacterium]|nr:ribonuclease P protein component [Flavobacteriales bacterium]HIN40249.1 ribonuclease P protein component [Flavobacteriales bacterium]
MEQSFKKEERLCSKVVIDQLFADGNSFVINPIRTIWIEHKHKHQYPAQVLLVVPKKNIPSAVKRNKIKRHMRECYRKNKEILYEGLLKSNKTIALVLIYAMNDQIIYQEMEKKIILSLRRLVEINEVDH